MISKRAIVHVAVRAASECYGISSVQGSKVKNENNKIDVDVSLYLRFGVTVDPVIESVRRAIKYNVESFTGMTVECVNIDVLGIQN